ncbi:MAG: DUF58 domain-containing protein, partial [Cyanobacteria bacterium P01_A01_bin.84]
SRRHDVVGVHLYDPREEELPNIGLIRAVDAETGRVQWVDTSVQAVRENYATWFQDNRQYFRSSFLKSGSDVLSDRRIYSLSDYS